MTRALAFDNGAHLGFGLLDNISGEVKSGSRKLFPSWQPFGPALLTFENTLISLIEQHRPTVLGVARPFVRRGKGGAMIDTPQNLVPMFGAYAVLHRLAAARSLRLEVIDENVARGVLLGAGMVPRASAAAKVAVCQACRDRGWPCCDDHAGDALCIAAAVIERLHPRQAHQTAPLFVAATRAAPTIPAPKSRRQRRLAAS